MADESQTVSVFWFWRHLDEIKHLSWLNWETIGLAGLVGAYAPIKAIIAPEYIPTLAQLQHLDWRVVGGAFLAGAVAALVHQITPTQSQANEIGAARAANERIAKVVLQGDATIAQAQRTAVREADGIKIDAPEAANLHRIMGDKGER
jgi:hypothetical protein